MYRHRLGARVVCGVSIVAFLVWAAISLAAGDLVHGFMAAAICGSPFAVLLSVRSVEQRFATRRDGDGGLNCDSALS